MVRTTYLEVRVGDTDAAAPHLKRPDYNKMCHNKLCFTSGKHHAGGNLGPYVEDDCVTPLTGKYVLYCMIIFLNLVDR